MSTDKLRSWYEGDVGWLIKVGEEGKGLRISHEAWHTTCWVCTVAGVLGRHGFYPVHITELTVVNIVGKGMPGTIGSWDVDVVCKRGSIIH